jgi:hypothetical protein
MDSRFNTEEKVILFDQEIHAMTLIYGGSSKSCNSPLYENSDILGYDAASIGN